MYLLNLTEKSLTITTAKTSSRLGTSVGGPSTNGSGCESDSDWDSTTGASDSLYLGTREAVGFWEMKAEFNMWEEREEEGERGVRLVLGRRMVAGLCLWQSPAIDVKEQQKERAVGAISALLWKAGRFLSLKFSYGLNFLAVYPIHIDCQCILLTLLHSIP